MGERISKAWSLPRLTSDIGRSLLLLLAVMLFPAKSYANQGFNGMCRDGGVLAQVLGINSTNFLQGSFPGCTVTVNIHGGGLATIFKDNINTPLSNPFTASSTDGSFLFYSQNGRYDVTVTATGLNYTYTDIILNDTSVISGASCAVAFSATPVFNAQICSSFSMTLTGNVTSPVISGGVPGQIIAISLTQGAGGPWSFTWPATVLNPPILTPTAGKAENFTLVELTDTNWHVSGMGEYPFNQIDALTGSGNVNVMQQSPTINSPIISTPTITQAIINQGANGVDSLSGSRFTDTSPTGNFLNFKSLAGSTLFKVDITGGMAVSNINHQRKADGFVYSFAGAGLLQGYADCVADANCSEFATDGIIVASLGSSQLNLVAGKTLHIRYGSSITGTGNPVVTYPPAGATIIGSSSDISNGSFSAIIATAVGSQPIGPASNSQNTQGLYIDKTDFWNNQPSSTATICNFTNVSNSTFISVHCQRSSASGTPSNILIQCSGASCAAFHNDFVGTQSFGPGISWDFEAPAGSASGPNAQHIYGGRGDGGTICIGVNQGGSTSIQINGISFSDFDCESYSSTGFSVQGPMINTNLSRVRFESPNPAQISNIANLGTIGVTDFWGVGVFNTQTRGTENGKVSWYGYQTGAPGPTTEDFIVGSVSALNFIQQNGSTPSTFTNTGTTPSPDIVQFSGDATANSNCIRQINTHTGGLSVCQGEIAQVKRYGWRNGNLGFFDVDFSGSNTGELTILHNCTLSQCQAALPNVASATIAGINVAQTWTAAQTIGSGGSIAVASLLVSPTVPTIAAGGCGGAAASIVVANGTAAFKVNVGTTPTSACTLTFPAATTGWNVTCNDITTQSTSVFIQKQTGAESTTSVTITNFSDVAVATAFVASDILKCTASAD